jgi:hypothetical protein
VRWKLTFLLALLAFLSGMALALRSCRRPTTGTTNEALTQKEIDKGTVAKVTIDQRRKTITTSKVVKAPAKSMGDLREEAGEPTVRTTTERFERRAVITQDVEGNLHVYAPKSGAICEGGLLAGYRGDFPVLGIDGQLLYYKAWGLNVGVNALVRGRMLPRAYVGVSYALPIEALSNTSVLVGIDTSKEVVLGLRVRL